MDPLMELNDLPTNDEWTEDDWREVFGVPNAEFGTVYGSGAEFYKPTVPTHAEKADPIALADVAAVETWHGYSPEGGGGSVDLLALLRLHDGRHAWVEAWADYTGWGCQDGITFYVGSRADLIATTITADQRARVQPPLT